MPRTLSVDFRNSLETVTSDEMALVFATVTHSSLLVPIRAVNDVVDYIYGGERYFGVPFEIVLLSDDDNPPTARIRIQNVDQIIGNALLDIPSSPMLTLTILALSDFGAVATVDDRRTRTEVGTPTVEMTASHLRLDHVTIDAVMVEAEIKSYDVVNEPYPSVRATHDRLPGLFMS